MTPKMQNTINHFKQTILSLTKDQDVPFKLDVVKTIKALRNGLNETEQKDINEFLGMCLYAKYCPLYNAKLVGYLCNTDQVNKQTFYHVIIQPDKLMQASNKNFRNAFTHQDIQTLFKNIDYIFSDYQDKKQFYYDHVYIEE